MNKDTLSRIFDKIEGITTSIEIDLEDLFELWLICAFSITNSEHQTAVEISARNYKLLKDKLLAVCPALADDLMQLENEMNLVVIEL